jgi:hypothetical protein
VLALPSLEKPFISVSVDKETALGVLTQKCGGKKQPTAYLSKILDPVTRGWLECFQAAVATALLTEESRKLTDFWWISNGQHALLGQGHSSAEGGKMVN